MVKRMKRKLRLSHVCLLAAGEEDETQLVRLSLVPTVDGEVDETQFVFEPLVPPGCSQRRCNTTCV